MAETHASGARVRLARVGTLQLTQGQSARGTCMHSARGDTHGLCPAWGWLMEPIHSGARGLGPTLECAWVS
jgi:hypothetical protein